MEPGHTSLAPYVDSAEDLYDVLQAGHVAHETKIARWALGMLLAATIGLAIPGPWGKLAWMGFIYAGMNWLMAVADYVARGWFMHMLTLREYISAQPSGDRKRGKEDLSGADRGVEEAEPLSSIH